jgi:hypothetical protein
MIMMVLLKAVNFLLHKANIVYNPKNYLMHIFDL